MVGLFRTYSTEIRVGVAALLGVVCVRELGLLDLIAILVIECIVCFSPLNYVSEISRRRPCT